MDAMASVRETARNGESIAQRSQRGNGGLDGGGSFREHRGLRARNKRNGESIAQRSQRPGMEVLMVGVLSVNTVASVRETSAIGESIAREITEAPRRRSLLRDVLTSCEFLLSQLSGRSTRYGKNFCGHQPKSPSVTSVRCFPFDQFLRPEATVLPIEFSGAPTQIPPL